MRLTLDVIGSAEQHVGPLKERIVSFRGLKIPAVENLGATNDHFDSIDFCDNDLIKLDNFPPLKRLETLLVANNRIMRLDPDVFHNLPSLKSLVLTNNKLNHLGDLTPLFHAKRLERISLVDNPVINHPNYRLYLIYNIPSIRFLDFQHVKDAERIEAKKLFGGPQGAALLASLTKTGTNTETPVDVLNGVDHTNMSDVPHPDEVHPQDLDASAKPVSTAEPTLSPPSLTQPEIAALQDAIASATSLSEVQRLEQALETGILPADLKSRLVVENC